MLLLCSCARVHRQRGIGQVVAVQVIEHDDYHKRRHEVQRYLPVQRIQWRVLAGRGQRPGTVTGMPPVASDERSAGSSSC